MRYLSLPEVLYLHEAILSTSGGSKGVRDINALESSLNQPGTAGGALRRR